MLHIETPDMTIAQLARHIEQRTEPVRRSTHVGNQPAKELVILCGLPQGVDVLEVDTIQADDRYSQPHVRIGAAATQQLVSRTQARGKIVGAVRTHDTHMSLTEIHRSPYELLPLTNHPVGMMSFFGAHSELLRAVMAACAQRGEIRREVVASGKITQRPEPTEPVSDIYGLSSTIGALLPLNGMMAIEMLIDNSRGSNSTLHLGGRDMMQYVMSDERMRTIESIMDDAAAAVSMPLRTHTYRIVDTRGLSCVTDVPSQHALLESGKIIDIGPHEQTSLRCAV